MVRRLTKRRNQLGLLLWKAPLNQKGGILCMPRQWPTPESICRNTGTKGRDPLYAKAMADPEIDLPEYGAEKGKYLTLSPSAAVEVAYAEGIVNDQAALLQELGLENATVVEMETTLAEELARFLTNPV